MLPQNCYSVLLLANRDREAHINGLMNETAACLFNMWLAFLRMFAVAFKITACFSRCVHGLAFYFSCFFLFLLFFFFFLIPRSIARSVVTIL